MTEVLFASAIVGKKGMHGDIDLLAPGDKVTTTHQFLINVW
jgi:hypothetical protein